MRRFTKFFGTIGKENYKEIRRDYKIFANLFFLCESSRNTLCVIPFLVMTTFSSNFVALNFTLENKPSYYRYAYAFIFGGI